MKKYLLGAAILALVVVFSAFSVKGELQKHQASEKGTLRSFDPAYHWFTPSGTYTGRTQSKIDEIPDSGCPDEGMLTCENGYTDADLNVPGNPQFGLKLSATVDEIIYKVD